MGTRIVGKTTVNLTRGSCTITLVATTALSLLLPTSLLTSGCGSGGNAAATVRVVEAEPTKNPPIAKTEKTASEKQSVSTDQRPAKSPPPRTIKTTRLPLILTIKEEDKSHWAETLLGWEGKLTVLLYRKIWNAVSPQVGDYKVGEILLPTHVFAGRILNTNAMFEDFSRQYGEAYDLQLVRLTTAFFPERRFEEILEAVQVELQMREVDDSESPSVLHVFPQTTFEEDGWKVSGQIGVTIGGFQQLPVQPNANVGVSFDYAPLIAKVISSGVGTHAQWRMAEAKNRCPVGAIDYYATVLVPRTKRQATADLTVTVYLKPEGKIAVPLAPQSIVIDFGAQ